MSALGLRILDDAAHSTNVWVNDINERLGWDNKHRAYRLMRAVLHAVRDHLRVDEAAQLAAQLPTLIRGIYYDGWNPSKTPLIERKADGFIALVQKDFETDPLGDAPQAIAAVIAVMRAHVSKGEMDEVENSFTTDIRALFG
ncbi:DUF2267 domain-containing protein [Aestuariivita boseongensis]|uniref:DUF2267 domain-containing protein n=1 Tax=Aestuariivita boseongensis TaxID=1470562 RepID=UPI00067FB8B2|nr:DUF2267 domain-containing protein [Aestuariivita boseongensis]